MLERCPELIPDVPEYKRHKSLTKDLLFLVNIDTANERGRKGIDLNYHVYVFAVV